MTVPMPQERSMIRQIEERVGNAGIGERFTDGRNADAMRVNGGDEAVPMIGLDERTRIKQEKVELRRVATGRALVLIRLRAFARSRRRAVSTRILSAGLRLDRGMRLG